MHKGTANAVPVFFIRRPNMSQIKKEQTLDEKWENATIANNFIFYKVMRTILTFARNCWKSCLNLESSGLKCRKKRKSTSTLTARE